MSTPPPPPPPPGQVPGQFPGQQYPPQPTAYPPAPGQVPPPPGPAAQGYPAAQQYTPPGVVGQGYTPPGYVGQAPAAPQPVVRPYQPQPGVDVPGASWKIPALVVGSLVTIGAVFAASAFMGQTAEPGAAARDAVVQLTTSMTDGDCDAYEDATTAAYRRVVGLDCTTLVELRGQADDLGMEFVVGEAVLRDNGTARVPVQVRFDDPALNDSAVFTVVRTGGTWKVNSVS